MVDPLEALEIGITGETTTASNRTTTITIKTMEATMRSGTECMNRHPTVHLPMVWPLTAINSGLTTAILVLGKMGSASERTCGTRRNVNSIHIVNKLSCWTQLARALG